MKKTAQNANSSEQLRRTLRTERQPESEELHLPELDNEVPEGTQADTQQATSSQTTTHQGAALTRITALILIAILFAAAYYLFITKQEQRASLPAPPPQPELIITLPQE